MNTLKDIRVEYECLGDLLMEAVFSPDTDSDVDPVKILAWENKEDETSPSCELLKILRPPLAAPTPCTR